MKISTRKSGKTIVLDLYGQLTVDGGSKSLRKFVETVTAAQASHMVLNLDNISRLDCTGIGELVALRCALQESGALLTLIKVAPRQKRMLELVGLLPALTVCNDLEEALARQENDTAMMKSGLAMRAVPGGYADPDVVNSAAMMSQTE
jgi:anti-sigma B factor antagonist